MNVLQYISSPSEITPILLSLDMLREFGLVINADSAHCYSTKLRCRIPVTMLPSGHLALALTPSESFETTGETKTLVEETAADMTAAVQEDLLEQGQRPIVASEESNDGDTKQVPRLPGSVIRDLIAAARQNWMRQWYQPSQLLVHFSDLIWLW